MRSHRPAIRRLISTLPRRIESACACRFGLPRAALGFAGAGAVVTLSLLLPRPGIAREGTRFLRQPAVSADRIACVHANDIWVVGRDGGRALRLTTDEGAETNPEFSPDGSLIAFSAQYEGNQDVYVVEADGGQPRRVTWHPSGDEVQGWTLDGTATEVRGARAVRRASASARLPGARVEDVMA